MPSDGERMAWRIGNADLIEYIQTPANQRSRFIASMAQSFAQWGSLTPAQTNATRRVMQELTEPVAGTSAEATGEDTDGVALTIPNGVFTINDGTEHLTYRIHTVRRGALQGKRIVKRQLQYGEFKGFGFLTREGTLKVWRSHYEDEARNERYIVWARHLIDALRERASDGHVPADESYEFTYAEGDGFTIQASTYCRRCNRALTDPTSISLNIGPECREREQAARTTAAPAHEPVTPTLRAPREGESIRFLGDPPTFSDAMADISDTADQSAEAMTHLAAAATPPIGDVEQHLIDNIATQREREQRYSLYGVQACEFCGRNDFQSAQGRGRHQSSCRRHYNGRTLSDRARAQLRAFRERNSIVREDGLLSGISVAARPVRGVSNYPPRTPRQPVTVGAPRTPNLSQLGTVIGGSVWEQ